MLKRKKKFLISIRQTGLLLQKTVKTKLLLTFDLKSKTIFRLLEFYYTLENYILSYMVYLSYIRIP